MAKGLLIHNPAAGNLESDLVPRLAEALGTVDVVSVQDLGPAENAPTRARQGHCEWIAVAGGDGTVESIAAALIGTSLPLGVLPAGTYNNFARSLNLPLDPLEACTVIRNGIPRPVDAGMADGQPFFEALGAGLDAALYPLGEEIKSGRLERWIDLFRKAHRYPPQTFTLTLDRPAPQALVRGSANEHRRLVRRLTRHQAAELTLSALMLTVSNGPYFGMNFAVAPRQRMDDGLLTVSVFSRYSKLQLWWHFFSIAGGRRPYLPKSVTFRVARLTLSGPRPLPIHLDGTPQDGPWPVEIHCLPGAVQVFQPA